MRICFKTPVKGNYQDVLAGFDRELFEALAPPLIRMDLIQFDGSQTGNKVHLKLKILGIFSQEWIVKITQDGVTNKQAWFVDEGRRLPSMIRSWEHSHIIEKNGEDSIIIDDIHVVASSNLMAFFVYPTMYLQFLWRKPIYKRYFKERFAKKLA